MAGFSRALVSSSLLFISVLITFSEAKEFLIGGKSDAWVIPSSQSQSLNKWAESSRFKIGDTLVLKYDAKKDSVLQVSRRDYMNCNTSSPIADYKDGDTKITLEKSRPYYFVSGAKGHCEQGQKVIVVVMSEKRASLAPAPSPGGFDGLAIAPTSAAFGLRSGLMVILGSLVGFVLV